jgi:hypothetical protein
MGSALQSLIVNIVKLLHAMPLKESLSGLSLTEPPSKWSRCGTSEFFEATLGGEHPILIEV